MVVHVLVDVAEEAGRDNGDAAESDRDKIHVLVRLGVGNLAGRDDHLVCLLAAGDAGDEFEVVEQGSGGEFDCFGDEADVRDAEFEHHSAADILDGVRLELLCEDVVVDGVADSAADDADGQSQSGHGGDEVIGADDGGHDGCRDDNAADTDTGEDQETPESGQVVDTGDSQAAAAGGHEDRGYDHQLTVVAAEDRQQPENDAGTCQDREANWETTNTNANGIVAINVEGLSRPEHDDGEEVGAGDEGDDQSQGENSRFLLQTRWEHGEFGEFDLPDREGDEKQEEAEQQWYQYVS